MNLAALAARGVSEFVYVFAPLPIVGATGSPGMPFAILWRGLPDTGNASGAPQAVKAAFRRCEGPFSGSVRRSRRAAGRGRC